MTSGEFAKNGSPNGWADDRFFNFLDVTPYIADLVWVVQTKVNYFSNPGSPKCHSLYRRIVMRIPKKKSIIFRSPEMINSIQDYFQAFRTNKILVK